MSMGSLGLGFSFTARDLASGTMARVERSFQSLDQRVGLSSRNMDSALGGMRGRLASLAGGALASFGIGQLVRAAGDFEEQMANVRASSSLTADEFTRLHDTALDIGLQTKFDPTEAATGFADLGQSGRLFGEQLQMIMPVLDLAAGSLGKLNVAASVGLTNQALDAFGLSVDKTAITVDRLMQTVNMFSLDADDLPLALSAAGSSARNLDQDLSETLIGLGLVRRSINGIERGGTALAVSMQRLGDPRTQKGLRSIGIEVADAEGKFRPYLDVIADLAPALDTMTPVKRAGFLQAMFGTDGLAGVNAVLTALKNGMSGVAGTGKTLVDNLRGTFDRAEGTAARFRDILLDTFSGQTQLLKGSLKTLAIVIGEPLAATLKPIVAETVRLLNQLITRIRALPAPVKNAIAGVLVAAAAFAAVAASVVALKGAIVLVPIVLKTAMAAVGSFAAALGPLALAIGGIAAVVAMAVIAYRENLGGIADATRRVFERVRVIYRALKQLFTDGGFSGAVREELNQVENAGLKRFAVTLYMIAFRIGRLAEGIRDGFVAAIEEARPIFAGLVDAFADLSHEIGLLFGGVTEGARGLPSQEFADFGATVGHAIGTVASWLVALARVWARVASGVVAGVRAASGWITQAFSLVGKAISDLAETWNDLWGADDEATKGAASASRVWKSLGEVLGWIVGVHITALGYALTFIIKSLDLVLSAVRFVIGAFAWLGAKVSDAIDWINGCLDGLAARVGATVDTVGGVFTKVVGIIEAVGERISRIIDAIVGGIRDAVATVTGLVDSVSDGLGSAYNTVGDGIGAVGDVFSGGTPLATIVQQATSTASTAKAATAPSALPATANAAAWERAFTTLLSQQQAATASPPSPPIHVALQLDGETIARAVHTADRDASQRSFSVASY